MSWLDLRSEIEAEFSDAQDASERKFAWDELRSIVYGLEERRARYAAYYRSRHPGARPYKPRQEYASEAARLEARRIVRNLRARRYRARNLAACKARERAYRLAHPEKHRARCLAWNRLNKDRYKQYRKAGRATRRAWRRRNKERVNALERARRARKKQASKLGRKVHR